MEGRLTLIITTLPFPQAENTDADGMYLPYNQVLVATMTPWKDGMDGDQSSSATADQT